MKQHLLLGAFVGLFGFAHAQNSVTFRVDMSQQFSISPDGVHIAGNFQAAAGYPSDWDPASAEMLDPDMDGIYELTVTLPNGTYQYKFVNGDAWGTDESVPSGCAVSNNREVTISGNTTVPVVCYAQCTACIVNPTVTFQVDMNQQTVSPLGVHVVGNWMTAAGYPANWNPGIAQMSDNNNDGIYELSVQIPSGTYEYKYVNGDDWGMDENSLPGACNFFGNRQVTIVNSVALTPFCFNTCATCPAPAPQYMITLTVDATNECELDSIDVAGTFNGWTGGNGYVLQPTMNDGEYAITLMVDSGYHEFKFRRYFEGNFSYEGFGGNRNITVSGPGSFGPYCYNSLGACTPVPGPQDITFRVDLGDFAADSAGVFLMGSFTIPAWQAGAIQLTQNPNYCNVWETTVSGVCEQNLAYLYVNGDPSGTGFIEYFPTGSTACLVPNGFGGWNRGYTRVNSNPIALEHSFNSCWGICEYLDPQVSFNNRFSHTFTWNADASATQYVVEFRGEGDSVYTTRFTNNTVLTFSFPGPNYYEYRVGALVNGVWQYSCCQFIEVDCVPMNVAIVEFDAPFCAGDNATYRANFSGGAGAKTYLWSTGATARSITVQPGTYWVTVTDAYGCSATDTIMGETAQYSDYATTLVSVVKSGAQFTVNWNPAVLPNGATVLGYRAGYRVQNTSNPFVTSALLSSSATSHVFDLSAECNANYEFVVYVRYQVPNEPARTSAPSCPISRGHNNGVVCGGAKNDGFAAGVSSGLLNVYPNPTRNSVFVSIEGAHAVVDVLDLSGKVLSTAQYSGVTEAQIELGHLPSGLYLIRATTDEEIRTARIVKE
ncbi:T9SS type A sorting domain-containing protein [bacterium]|nr:T9SS type A sorting domain-containing protein [bacterium]